MASPGLAVWMAPSALASRLATAGRSYSLGVFLGVHAGLAMESNGIGAFT